MKAPWIIVYRHPAVGNAVMTNTSFRTKLGAWLFARGVAQIVTRQGHAIRWWVVRDGTLADRLRWYTLR